MRTNSTKNRTAKFRSSLTRGRVAVVGGGLVAALALGGTTAALAADNGTQHGSFLAASSTSSISASLAHQASGQHAAAVKAQAAAKKARAEAVADAKKAKAEAAAAKIHAAAEKKAAAAAKKRAKAEAAAHRKAVAASWEAPTTHYVLGAGYHQVGKHWIATHSGQDFVVPSGTTVRAAHTGTVVTAGWGGAYGNNIVIKNGSHLYTQYGHLSHIEAHVGERVTTGEEIGKSGSTGNSTGPHLHFEVRTTPYYGSSVEPLHFLKTHGVTP